MPTEGFRRRNPFTGAEVVHAIKACPSCGTQFDGSSWAQTEDDTVFRSRVVITLQAEGYEEYLPTMRDGCPQVHRILEDVIGKRVREVFIDW